MLNRNQQQQWITRKIINSNRDVGFYSDDTDDDNLIIVEGCKGQCTDVQTFHNYAIWH